MSKCYRCGGTVYEAVEGDFGRHCSPLCADRSAEDRRLDDEIEAEPACDRFGLDEGRERRDRGIETVQANSRDEFCSAFEAAFASCAALRRPFTSDDVTRRLSVEPHHPNAIGALMRWLAIAAGMSKVGYVPGQRKHVHAAVVAQWARPEWLATKAQPIYTHADGQTSLFPEGPEPGRHD